MNIITDFYAFTYYLGNKCRLFYDVRRWKLYTRTKYKDGLFWWESADRQGEHKGYLLYQIIIIIIIMLK